MAGILPSEKLMQEQSRIARWREEQQRRRKQLFSGPPDPGLQRLERAKRLEEEYKQYREKTRRLYTPLTYFSTARAITSSIAYHSTSPMAKAIGMGMDTLYTATKPISMLSKIKRAQYERMYEKELGFAGKFTRGLDVISNLGALYYYPKLFSLLTGLPRFGLPASPTTMIGMAVPHGINLGLQAVGHFTGKALPLLPTTGLGGIATNFALGTLPIMLASMAASMVKARKLAKLQVQRKSGQEVERKASLSSSIHPQISRLISEHQLTPADQLKLQLLQWIESHTSVIPIIYEELDLLRQGKEKGTVQLEKSEEIMKSPEKERKSLLTRIENVVHGAVLKYDPIVQILNYITARKKPKEALEEFLGTKDKEKEKYVEQQIRTFGLNREQYQLLTMDSSQILRMTDTYEGKLLAIQSGIYDLIRLASGELTAIRAHGFGISEHLLGVRSVMEEKSIFGRLFSTLKNITSLPGINAIWNIIKFPFEAPKRVVEFFEEKVVKRLKKFLFGEDYIKILENPEELLKRTGLYKSDQELAFSFLGRALPPLVEDIRKVEVEQLEVQQNIYYVLQEQLKQLTGLEISYEETQKALKEGREWSTTLGRYLSKKDYLERRKMEEQLIKYEISKAFGRGPLGWFLSLLGGGIESRFKRAKWTTKLFGLGEQFPEAEEPEKLAKMISDQLAGRLPEGFKKTFSEKILKEKEGTFLDKLRAIALRGTSALPVFGGYGAMIALTSTLGNIPAMFLPLLGIMGGAWTYERLKRKFAKQKEEALEPEISEAYKKTEEELIKKSIPRPIVEIQKEAQKFQLQNFNIFQRISNLLEDIRGQVVDFKEEITRTLTNIYDLLRSKFESEDKRAALPRARVIKFQKPKEYLQEKRIPKFAEGGVVTKESVIQVAEKDKKEAIIPLENKRALSTISETIGEKIRRTVEEKSKTRTLQQELKEVEEKRERQVWAKFRTDVIDLLTKIAKSVSGEGGLSKEEEKKSEKDIGDLFGFLKWLGLSLAPSAIKWTYRLGKKALGKTWEFIKSPTKWFRRAGEAIKSVVSKGKSIISKSEEIGEAVVGKGGEVLGKVGEVAKAGLGRIGEIGGKVLGRAGEIGTKILPKGVARVLGRVGLRVGGKLAGRTGSYFIPIVGQAIAAGLTAYDLYKGWKEAGKAFGLKEGEEPTLGMKISSALGRALTLGLSEKKAAQFIYKVGSETEEFVNRIVSFPIEVLNKFKEYASEKLRSFKDAVSSAFQWILDLPEKLVDAIKEFLKNTFVGKLFKGFFGGEEETVTSTVESAKLSGKTEVHEAASGGLFLRESITRIAEQNKPEVVLPLENPRTHEIIQKFTEIYQKKYERPVGDERESLIKSALETVQNATTEIAKPAVITVPIQTPQPVITQPIQQPGVAQSRTGTGSELQIDFVIEKHLNDIFKNTIITLEKSIEDYIYGNLAFNVI